MVCKVAGQDLMKSGEGVICSPGRSDLKQQYYVQNLDTHADFLRITAHEYAVQEETS
jgi:hypothetical protein